MTSMSATGGIKTMTVPEKGSMESPLVKSEENLSRLNRELMTANEKLTASEEELRQQFDELLNREEAIRRQNFILSSLHEAALGLMQSEEITDVLELIVSNATKMLDTPHGYISLVDEKKGVFHRKIGLGHYARDIGRDIKITEGIVGQIYKHGEMVIVNDYKTWEKRLPGPFFDALHSVAQVPLKAGNKVVGTFGVAFLEPERKFGEQDKLFLGRFADLASIALMNATLVNSYKMEIQERMLSEKALRISESKYRAILEAANEGIFIHDVNTGKILDINEKACEIYGYSREEMLSNNLRLLGSGEPPYTEKDAMEWLRLAAAEPRHFEWKNRCRDGSTAYLEVYLKRTLVGNEDRIVAIVRDISERKAQERVIRRMAYYDSLTGLPNRAYIQEHLALELEKEDRGDTKGVVLFVDMDDLKMINDTHGHSCGDGVIITAGAYLFAEAGEKAVVARIGGDEFIVWVPGEIDRGRISSVADRMVKILGREYATGETKTHMSASIGIAFYPTDGDTVDDIFKNADLALYAAKGSGKNTWRFYDPILQTIAYENMNLKHGLREAIERGELYLNYQSLIDTLDGKIVGYEALLRWKSSEYGVVEPKRFIPLAEESNLIIKIGRWVIAEACAFARKLQDMGNEDVRVSINVSPLQLEAADFVQFVSEMINEAGIRPNQIEIEITENALMSSLVDSIFKLLELCSIGVHLSLDDFGTGYSSLTYLRDLPVGTLKIDKSFIDQITVDAGQLQFVCSIIDMAHVLNLKVVAEGVETREQMEKLTESKCDFIQGYYFSYPVSETEAILQLKRS